MEQIDEQGLLFLLRQAQVLIHNARVEKLNQKAAARSSSDGGEEPADAGSEGAGHERAATGRRPARGSSGVTIEESGNSNVYFLVIGKERKVMDGGEVRRLARICASAESRSEALDRLYRVLKQERRDILVDAGIRDAFGPVLDAVYKALRDWKGGT